MPDVANERQPVPVARTCSPTARPSGITRPLEGRPVTPHVGDHTHGQILEVCHQPDKLNIGALGNIVNQLHIHILGRFDGDPAGPDLSGVLSPWHILKNRRTLLSESFALNSRSTLTSHHDRRLTNHQDPGSSEYSFFTRSARRAERRVGSDILISDLICINTRRLRH